MSSTTLDVLQNAQANFETVRGATTHINPIFNLAMEQLEVGIDALKNGLEINSIVQENIFGEVKTSK